MNADERGWLCRDEARKQNLEIPTFYANIYERLGSLICALNHVTCCIDREIFLNECYFNVWIEIYGTLDFYMKIHHL